MVVVIILFYELKEFQHEKSWMNPAKEQGEEHPSTFYLHLSKVKVSNS